MFSLFFSLALLGLSAIDPIGIAAMPVLLLQKKPFARSFVFLGGSFISLMVMGLLFSKGLGRAVLHFENAHGWFISSVEAVAGVLLLSIAGTLLWRLRTGKASVDPSASMVHRLRLNNRRLFVLGATLVAIQSVADVVFVIAMIRIGQLKLSDVTLTAAVATYAVAALVFQFAVVAAYKLAPPKQRAMTLDTVHRLLTRYANQTLIGVSFVLGCVLLALAP